MIAVIFEVEPRDGHEKDYFERAANLRPLLEKMDGFISVERFRSLANALPRALAAPKSLPITGCGLRLLCVTMACEPVMRLRLTRAFTIMPDRGCAVHRRGRGRACNGVPAGRTVQ
jgi:Antibiotic biosynthesis monooxygenase